MFNIIITDLKQIQTLLFVRMIYNISNLTIVADNEVNSKIYNIEFMKEAAKQYYILMDIINNNEFNKLSNDNKEYVVKDIIKRNKLIISDEMKRLLNITVEFINTKYFRDLYKLSNLYIKLLDK